MAQNGITFLRSSFTLIFQKIQQTSRVTVFFPNKKKNVEKKTKITRFELLRRAFIHRDQAFKRVPKIMQNYAKMHRKSPQNEHEKMWISVLQWSEKHVVASPAKMHQNAFIFCRFRYRFAHAMDAKSLKIVEN